jgi:hypothetical protein
MSFDNAIKARDRILATIDQLIEEFIIENTLESEKPKTLIIGCMIYGKNKDDNRMLT